MDIRVRMVVLGLVLGVVVAVIVAAQGCGQNHPGKRRFHASGGGASSASAPAAGTSSAGASGTGASAAGSSATRSKRVRATAAHSGASVRRTDPHGPFFAFSRGRMRRVDAPRRGRLVALTFDDGPGPQTAEILAELQRLHAPATFFIVGSMAAARPDLVRAEARAGMQIGNHTWSHPPMPTLSRAAQRAQIESTNAILRRLTGRRPRFFRPPNWRAGAITAHVVSREHMIGVLRTVDTRDWTLPGTAAIVRRALRVRPGGIIAMHDAGGYTRAQTVAAVPPIVHGLRRMHLRLVTIGDLFAGRG